MPIGPGKPRNRGIRGIRHPIAGGMVVGRNVQGGIGAAESISIQDIIKMIQSTGTFQPATPPPSHLFIFTQVDADHEVMLLSNVPASILQFNLTMGSWDVSASATFDPTHGSFSTFSNATVTISPMSGFLPDPPNEGGYVNVMAPLNVAGRTTLTTAIKRIVVTVPQEPWWLVVRAVFT